MNTLTTAQMMSELTITFPALWKRPLSEFGADYAGQEGVWTGGDGDKMQDGDPIFCSLANGEPPYNGSVHEGFEAWLANRGWGVDRYDGETYFLVPEAYFHCQEFGV